MIDIVNSPYGRHNERLIEVAKDYLQTDDTVLI